MAGDRDSIGRLNFEKSIFDLDLICEKCNI